MARLCELGPRLAVRAVRARALAALAGRDSDTLRWSALLTERFVPPFASFDREHWAEELEAYDATLAARQAEATSPRVAAELLQARVAGRLFIDRRWDWLTQEERSATLDLVTTLESEHGDALVPGGSDPERDTVLRRARAARYELTTLAFRAPAPATFGQDLDGEPLDLADLRGRVVVLDFWTTFCQPCLALVPEARRILSELEGEPVVYVGVNGDPDASMGAATARRVGMPWRNLWDGPRGTEGPAATAWAVAAIGWPSVFVLDGRGRIRAKLRGQEQVEAELEAVLRALLSEE